MALARTGGKNPFKDDQVVVAVRTFAWEGGTVTQGEKHRGRDHVVVRNWTAFADDATTLPSEYENPFDGPPPPEHAPPAHVHTTSIPVFRQVVSAVDLMQPVKWAPARPGTETNRPPPFVRTHLRRGQILDVLSPVVKQNPGWFVWPKREVSAADVERFERYEPEVK